MDTNTQNANVENNNNTQAPAIPATKIDLSRFDKDLVEFLQSKGLSSADIAAKLKVQNGLGTGGGTVRFQLAQSGGISAYGLGRMPTTLYASQWVRLTKAMGGSFDPKVNPLAKVLVDNYSKLTFKDNDPNNRQYVLDAISQYLPK